MLRSTATPLIPIALIALVVLPLALDRPFGRQIARTRGVHDAALVGDRQRARQLLT